MLIPLYWYNVTFFLFLRTVDGHCTVTLIVSVWLSDGVFIGIVLPTYLFTQIFLPIIFFYLIQIFQTNFASNRYIRVGVIAMLLVVAAVGF